MDKITIEDFEVFAYHGVLEEEKTLGQKFLLSLYLDLDLRKSGISKALNDTVNYAELLDNIEEEFTKQSFDLIETAAEKIAEFILLNYNLVKAVKVILKKPWAPVKKHVKCISVEIERSWHTAYIGLGSNIGNKEENLKEALALIEKNFQCVLTEVSNFYITRPVGYLNQDNFLNCAAEIKTLMSPNELVDFFLRIEETLKRKRTVHWGPRTIDLDVLLYDNLITDDPHITLPHPRMTERLFVLTPLCDINPNLVHPVLNDRIINIKNNLSKVQVL
ncbi:2-amino-4-hydroxy-6-hydroxymethyldihydropteridine diphosphokinase [Clostridium felsineum]|uniref:Bifunctional folate synthesis protein n=1 Tax=Clostridium felsineum TaxID=36839 RepID=A0A1S8LSA4_9CLOT|nr:2-amino-4-hydroxy-6-hydroxymethyldihydropteridine diphosphokinase [Clostridium felsineum]MCR3758328.1 2-amino-4-hydroxy-6-hydroxymethyldihydropteridine diphosphokinase [Clostridium felsineum]URZ03681.1 Bifunctional folate synthesis protein [Clostridium felsineum]URZ08006.1 Bifunctional folate synthesis protein [Clostridium felsineum]URZ13037.1 Bifunctional folate synthesis protein [Clostridium felsineum]URZ14973.1 Bifunctional folate synthesis protein [Clostridium felsineum DSM 794]